MRKGLRRREETAGKEGIVIKKKKKPYLEQRQPRAHPGGAPVRRGDHAQLGRHGGVAVRAGPELGEGDLKGLVLLDAAF